VAASEVLTNNNNNNNNNNNSKDKYMQHISAKSPQQIKAADVQKLKPSSHLDSTL